MITQMMYISWGGHQVGTTISWEDGQAARRAVSQAITSSQPSSRILGQLPFLKMQYFLSLALLAALGEAVPVTDSPEAGSTTSDVFPPASSMCTHPFHVDVRPMLNIG